MGQLALRVESLSKRYLIGHRKEPPGRYVSLRDVLAREAGAIIRRTRDAMAGRAFVPGDVREEFWALRDIGFEIRQGERVGIVGRNGAGKSTLLKVLSRITEPTRGRVTLRGRIASLLEVGTGFHPELTGRENIYLNGSILGMSRREIATRFDEIVAFAEVERFLDTPVKRYSSGMYMRLAFSVAAHLDPETLIVDEVLAVGDARFQAKCMGRMRTVGREGRTILFVSHNTVAVQGLCTRAILLRSGRLEHDGPVPETLSRYGDDVRALATGDLASRTDRKGDGRIRLTGVRFITPDGDPLGVVTSGNPVNVRIQFEASQRFEHVDIGFILYEQDGEILLNFNNGDVGRVFSCEAGPGIFECRIPYFPLRAGSYLGNLHCVAGGDVADFIRPAFSLDVVDGDVHGTGRLIDQGRFVCNYDWVFEHS